MTHKDYEKIRKSYYPFHMIFTVLAILAMAATVIGLIILRLDSLTWWQYLILAIFAIIWILIFFLGSHLVNKKYLKKYNEKYQKDVVNPLVKEIMGVELNTPKKGLDVNIPIIGKKHKYKVLNEIHTDDFSIYELSMLNDLRFRGFLIERNVETKHQFIIVNYNYYFKVKFKNGKIKTFYPPFDHKFNLYSPNKDFDLEEKVYDKFIKMSRGFSSFGIYLDKDKLYYMAGFKALSKDANRLNLSITDKVDKADDVEIKRLLQRLKEIATYNF